MSNQYKEDSIQKLSPLEFTRLRPDTYLGSNEDPTQLAIEIITNCIDEHLIGNCDEIYITIDNKKHVVTVTDKGQGILPSVKKDGDKTVLEMVYGDINTSGKYDKSEDSVYKVSTGAFGIGASLSNFLSHYLIARTRRDGKFETVKFVEGKFQERDEGFVDTSEHGVTVEFQPNEEFFRSIDINIQKMRERLFYISCICPKLKIWLNGEEIYNPKGLDSLLDVLCDKKMEMTSRLEFKESKKRQELDFALTYTDAGSSSITAFCNYGLIENGTVVTAMKSCITRTLNKWAKQQGILKAKDKNLSGESLQEGMLLVFNLVSPMIRYDSQTKVRVTSTEDNSFINEVVAEQLEIWLDNNPIDGKVIIEKALVARKAAEAAKKAREQVKAKANVKVKQKIEVLPSKLSDANSKDRSQCEVYIVEGDSAAGGAKTIRDAKTQAIMPLRGKPLNVLTAQQKSILANQEIRNMVDAFGCEWSADKKTVLYNKQNMRYNKIIIASDADPDGSHIQSLLLAFFWTMIPELLLDGFVYLAVPPRYKVEWGKDNYKYLADDTELEEFKKTHSNFVLSYFKGLGEMDPHELGAAIMNPATRKIEQVTINDIQAFDKWVSNLMGKDSKPKHNFVFGEEE